MNKQRGLKIFILADRERKGYITIGDITELMCWMVMLVVGIIIIYVGLGLAMNIGMVPISAIPICDLLIFDAFSLLVFYSLVISGVIMFILYVMMICIQYVYGALSTAKRIAHIKIFDYDNENKI